MLCIEDGYEVAWPDGELSAINGKLVVPVNMASNA
jgi:hypothetical protein